ncbi:hypothetical protein ACWCOT_41380 [Nonomuraea bangladeshensis]
MTAMPVPADLAHLVSGTWMLDGDAAPRGLPHPLAICWSCPTGRTGRPDPRRADSRGHRPPDTARR